MNNLLDNIELIEIETSSDSSFSNSFSSEDEDNKNILYNSKNNSNNLSTINKNYIVSLEQRRNFIDNVEIIISNHNNNLLIKKYLIMIIFFCIFVSIFPLSFSYIIYLIFSKKL